MTVEQPELDEGIGEMWMLDFDQLDATSRRIILEALKARQAEDMPATQPAE